MSKYFNRAAIESVLTTLVALGGAFIAANAAGVVSVPADKVALVTSAVAVIRYVLAALNPNQKAYGKGAKAE